MSSRVRGRSQGRVEGMPRAEGVRRVNAAVDDTRSPVGDKAVSPR